MIVRIETLSCRTESPPVLHDSLTVVRRDAASRAFVPGIALLVALLIVLALTSSAVAAQTRRAYTGLSFGPGGTNGSEGFGNVQSMTVDQTSGDILVYDIVQNGAEGRLYRFSAAGAPINFPASGENSIRVPGAATELGAEQVAVAPASSPGGTAGDIYVATNLTVEVYSPTGVELGTLGEGETCGVAVDPTGQIFIGSFGETIREYTPAANPANDTKTGETQEGAVAIGLCNIAADGAGNIYASNYEGGVTAKLKGIEDTNPTVIEPGGVTLATDPLSNELFLDRGDHISAYDSAAAPSDDIGAGQLTESYGVTVRSSTGWVYASDRRSGTVKAFAPRYPTTEPATQVGPEMATLHGIVRPEGQPYTSCSFEYGLVTASDFEKVASCEPEVSKIPSGSSSYPVALSLEGLQRNSHYKFRLTVTDPGGTIQGETLTFSTVGPPQITEVLSRDAGQESATLEATINPNGAETFYRIEWGTTDGYGNVAGAGVVTAGGGPKAVSAQIRELSPATTYHYRIVAESAEGGNAASVDQIVETLNDCGFTDDRCLELVSLAAKGPLAAPGKFFRIGQQIQFQAATGGSAFAFTVYYGYPNAVAGDAALYLARRGDDGWSSEQLQPPNSAPAQGGNGSFFKTLSSDLGCAVVASSQALASGAPVATVETGGDNLYVRDNSTGTYRLVSYLPPAAPQPAPADEYEIIGSSPDCSRVIFRTEYRYPGIPAISASKFQLYEWDNGVLRNLAIIPGPSGSTEPVPAEAIPGALDKGFYADPIGEKEVTNYWRSVSTDADRTIFTAVSRFGGDATTRAIFLRDLEQPGVIAGTTPATDISQSETATPNDGNSRYWTASTDGQRIFFTARYGLARNGSSSGPRRCANTPFGQAGVSSGEGCDLYEYDAGAPAGGRLTDLSPDQADPRGAGVVGVLDASEDGSYVYFASRGRLGGDGRTYSDNFNASTYNVYLAHAGTIHFVGSLGQTEAIGSRSVARALISNTPRERFWTSRSTSDGSTFVYESSLGVPGGVPMVYLYSAAQGATVCVSCRRDGQPPFSEYGLEALIDAGKTDYNNRVVQPTVLTDNGRLYFYSFDKLTSSAVDGARNLYQWENSQVSLLATEPPGVTRAADGSPVESFFGGASADGDDVYFATPQSLAGGAGPGWNVYDARVDGGLPERPVPAPPCDATVEGSCNSGGVEPPPGASPPTSSFGGPGNPPAKRHEKKRQRRRHKPHKQKHHAKGGKSHRSNKARRAGK